MAYAAAERIEGSGVLAVAVVGLYLGRRWTKLVRAESRIQMTAFWKMVNFVLESVVFLLVGLQMRDIVDDLNMPTGDVVTATVVVLVTVVVVRLAWMVAAILWGRLSPGSTSPDRHRTSLRTAIVLGWAGMRGVITLAAAFTLPHTNADGSALTDRNLLIWLAFAVIVATLLGQGLTLAPLIRWLGIPRDDPTEERLAVAQVQKAATKAALVALDQASDGVPDEIVDQLRRLAERRTKKKLERLSSSPEETPSEAHRRLRRVMLAAEQSTYRAAYYDGRLSHNAMRKAQRHFDLEESLLG